MSKQTSTLFPKRWNGVRIVLEGLPEHGEGIDLSKEAHRLTARWKCYRKGHDEFLLLGVAVCRRCWRVTQQVEAGEAKLPEPDGVEHHTPSAA